MNSVKGKSKVKGGIVSSPIRPPFHGTAAELRSLLRSTPGAKFWGEHLGTGRRVFGAHQILKTHGKAMPPRITVHFA